MKKHKHLAVACRRSVFILSTLFFCAGMWHSSLVSASGMNEMQRALDLVSINDATHETVRNGRWNRSSTWKNGIIPSDGARVVINEGHRVVLLNKPGVHLMSLRVDGTLKFHPRKNTELIADTIVATMGSLIQIGSQSRPIQSNASAAIIIKDKNNGFETINASSPDYDPAQLGQGLISFGRFVAHGAVKTPYIAMVGAFAGDTELQLDQSPLNWQLGDAILIAGTSKQGDEAERRTIVAINATSMQITLDRALDFSHTPPEHSIDGLDLKVHVANLSRNINIQTDESGRMATGQVTTNRSGDVFNARGHVMFMHNNNVDVRYVGFNHLGRTNKLIFAHDTTFSESDQLQRIGKNPRARYPVHFHRAGSNSQPAHVEGNVVVTSPGWGYVNHSSNVDMLSNIAYRVAGASFVTEAGDELGSFVRNLSIENPGLGSSALRNWKDREPIEDWGFHGHAFWFNGVYVDVIDNIANGAPNTAYGIVRKAIDGVSSVMTEAGEVRYAEVAFKTFSGNQAYGNSGGVLGTLGGLTFNYDVFSNTLAYANSGMGNSAWLSWWYPRSVVIDGITMINDIYAPSDVAIGTQSRLYQSTIIDPRIEGFDVGIQLPHWKGVHLISGGYLNNVINMLHEHGESNYGVKTLVTGDMQFGVLSEAALNGRQQVKIKMQTLLSGRKASRVFTHNYLYFDIDGAGGAKRLYADVEQAATFRTPIEGRLTNQQRVNRGLMPVGGAIWPSQSVLRNDMDNVRAEPVSNYYSQIGFSEINFPE